MFSAAAWADDKPDERIRRVFEVKMHQALEAFDKGDYAHTIQYADEAEIIIPEQTATKNLKAAVLYKQKKYDEALVLFDQIAADEPTFTARFNCAEVKLAQKKYDEALTIYRSLLKSSPNSELCRFKVVITLLRKGDKDDVRQAGEQAGAMALPGRSAAGFYARAAVAYQAGEKGKGMDWVNKSEEYFSREDSEVLREVMVESGWWKSDRK